VAQTEICAIGRPRPVSLMMRSQPDEPPVSPAEHSRSLNGDRAITRPGANPHSKVARKTWAFEDCMKIAKIAGSLRVQPSKIARKIPFPLLDSNTSKLYVLNTDA
jgi:hypothetical protein